MREAKSPNPAARQERRPASDSGDCAVVPVASLSRTVSTAQRAAAPADPSSNLTTLKTLISNHRVLLAAMRRGNAELENDNARMERELSVQAQEHLPVQALEHAEPAGRDDDGETTIPLDNTKEKLRWIENYLHGTLAQTLWALDVRAARLEEQVAVADRHEARRVLEMTHAAYDQLRSLMAELHGSADD
jgi:hypothetical protein